MIRAAIVALLTLTSLVFLVNVYDGTFLDPYILYVLTIALIAISLSEAMGRFRIEITLQPAHIVFFLYLLASSVSLFRAVNLRLGLESLAQLACLFVICYFSTTSLTARLFVKTIAVVTAIASAIALAYLVIPRSSEFYQTFQQLAKGSTFGNQTYFAGFILLALPILASQVLEAETKPVRRMLYGILAIVAFILLVRTESRSGWLAAVISAGVFGVLNFRTARARWIALLAGAAITVVVIVLFNDLIARRLGNLFDVGAQSSISRRMFFYEGAWRAFLASPLIGNGIGNFVVFLPTFRSPEYWMVKSEDVVPHAHNEFLEILSETGLIGLILFGVLVFMVFRNLAKAIRGSGKPHRAIYAAIIASMVGVLVDNLFSLNLRTIPVAVSFWAMVGVSLNAVGGKGLVYAQPIPTALKRMQLVPLLLIIVVAAVMIPDILNRYSSEKEYLSGLLLRFQNRSEEATEKFRLAAERNPHFAEAKFYLAAQLLEYERYDEALKVINDLRGEYPHYPKAQLILALASFSLGDTAAAMRAITEEISVGNSPQVYLYGAELSRRSHHAGQEFDYLGAQLRSNILSGMHDYAAGSVGRLGELSVQLQRESECTSLLDSLSKKFSGDEAIQQALKNLREKIDSTRR